MNTKKGWWKSAGALLFATALVFGISLAEPEEACAGDCQFDWYSANAWGMGANCAAAKTACANAAESTAEASCAAENKGLCATGSISYNSCYASGGQIKVDCVLQYKCDGGPDIPFD